MTRGRDPLKIDNRSPADRGSADAYYWRTPSPHKIVKGKRIVLVRPSEIDEYMNAYRNEEDRKDYGVNQ